MSIRMNILTGELARKISALEEKLAGIPEKSPDAPQQEISGVRPDGQPLTFEIFERRFKEIERVVAGLTARLEALEQRRGPGRPPIQR